jgi:hypothetical protein
MQKYVATLLTTIVTEIGIAQTSTIVAAVIFAVTLE